jgi:hypothetical protein
MARTSSSSGSGSAPTTAEEYAAAQVREWSTYVATSAIDHFGVRAYNAGDPVAVSAVEGPDAWVPQELVRKIADDAPAFAESATVVDPTPPTVDPTTIAAPVAAGDTVTTSEG